MKFKLSLEDFLNPAFVISKGIDTKNNGTDVVICINPETNKLEILTRSQLSYFEGSVLVSDLEDCSEQKEWSVEPSQFKAIVSILPKTGDITFTMDEQNRSFNIEVGDSKFNLAVADSVSFIRETNIAQLGTVSASEFIANLNSVSKVCSTNPTHSEHPMSCLHISIDSEIDNKITFMGTNGASMVEIKQSLEDNTEKYDCRIKTAQVNALLLGNFKGDDILPLLKTNTMFGYTDSHGVICLVAVTDFPAMVYLPVLARTTKDKYIEVNSVDFKYAIETLGTLSTGQDLKFVLEDGTVTVYNENEDKIKLQTTGDFENTEIKILKNPLSQLAKFMKGNFRVYWTGNSGARILRLVQITDNGEDDNYYVITSNDRG